VFTPLIFLVLLTLLIEGAPLGEGPLPSFYWVIQWLSIYVIFLFYVVKRNQFIKKRTDEFKLTLSQVDLCIFFACSLFIHYGAFFLQDITPTTLRALIVYPLYFLGLGIVKYNLSSLQAMKRLLFFLSPYTLFFFLISVSYDVAAYLLPDESWLEWVPLLLLAVVATLSFPLVAKLFWQLKKIEDPQIQARFDTLAKRAGLTTLETYTWPVLSHHTTAATIGLTPKRALFLFTEPLLKLMNVDELEAILAHEIGHLKKRHLPLMALILLTAAFCISLLASLFPLSNFLQVLLFAASYALFFRFGFGFLLRLFERQADLYVLRLGVPGEALISALDSVAKRGGNTHRKKSWTHYSIQERIDFLKKAIQNPQEIDRIDQKVKSALTLYFLISIIALAWILYKIL